jgi:hypothetical protein
MKPNVRAAVAAIALSHALQAKVSSVYAYGSGEYINIEAEIDSGHLTAYDYSAGCHIDGDIPNLYHYGQSGHLEFKPEGGGRYTGYDYCSGSHFETKVTGTQASVYDYGEGSWFEFST